MGLRRGKDEPQPAGGTGEVATRAHELVLRSSGVARRAPAYDGLPDDTHLPLAAGLPLRMECWDRLPGRVAERVEALAGDRIEWWARAPSGRREPAGPGGQGGPGGPGGSGRPEPVAEVDLRPSAVLIGERGACLAQPRIDARHRPVYTITRYELDPASHRWVDVIWPPPAPADDDRDRRSALPAVRRRGEPLTPATDAVVANGPAVRAGAAVEDPWRAVPGIDPAARELLGSLPVRAQKLLAAPFDPAHPVLARDWHYEGTDLRFSVFGVVLIGAGQLGLAHGSRVIPAGGTEQTAHWSLVCRRALVRGRSVEQVE